MCQSLSQSPQPLTRLLAAATPITTCHYHHHHRHYHHQRPPSPPTTTTKYFFWWVKFSIFFFVRGTLLSLIFLYYILDFNSKIIKYVFKILKKLFHYFFHYIPSCNIFFHFKRNTNEFKSPLIALAVFLKDQWVKF